MLDPLIILAALICGLISRGLGLPALIGYLAARFGFISFEVAFHRPDHLTRRRGGNRLPRVAPARQIQNHHQCQQQDPPYHRPHLARKTACSRRQVAVEQVIDCGQL